MMNYDENDDVDDDESNDESISKSEIIAERLLKKCHVHDVNSGGVLSLVTGGLDCAKTSVMLSFVDYTLEHHPTEKLFWSNTYFAPIQSLRIGIEKHHIMVKEDSNVTFHDRAQRLKEIHPKITRFNDFDDLYQKAIPGLLNCVFFGQRNTWMDFVHYLRGVGQWCHVYIDELSEICPAFTSGDLFKQIGQFSIERINLGLSRAKKEGKALGRPKGKKDGKVRRKSGYYQRWAKK